MAVQGQTVSAISGSPAANLSVVVGNYRGVTTNADGEFNVDGARPGTYSMRVRGDSIVDRDTTIAAAGTPARVSVIPSAFDLTAFDEMFRGGERAAATLDVAAVAGDRRPRPWRSGRCRTTLSRHPVSR